MGLPAFYIKSCLVPGQTALLEGEQANHAHALRLRIGEEAEVFNGQGQVTLCTVSEIARSTVTLTAVSTAFMPPAAARSIVALAMSKAVRRGFFMEKAAELGAAEVWLWQAERSVALSGGGAMGACARQIMAGALQSHNPWFPQLKQVNNVHGIVAEADAAEIQWRILPWEEQERTAMLQPEQLGRAGTTLFVIGPEGGLTVEEVDTLKAAGFAVVSLGRQVLRCETAAGLCLGLQSWAAQLPGKPDAA